MATKPPVYISETILMGDKLWAVETPFGFWLDAYPTRRGAESFCMRHNLQVLRINEMDDVLP